MARYLITLDSEVHADNTSAQAAITAAGASVVKSYTFSLTFEVEATEEQLTSITGVVESTAKNTVTSVAVQVFNQAHLTHLASASYAPATVYEPLNTGTGGDVYLVDTGIYADHEQFAGRSINNLYSNFGSDFSDTVGHGTAVGSAIVGASLGVSKDATLHNIKLFNSATGDITIGEIIDALDAVLVHHNTNNPSKAKVVCLPWVTTQNNFLDNKIAELNASNLVVVAAAGNNGSDVNNYSPAGVNSIITVGAYDADYNVTAFTNVPWTDPTTSYYTNYGASLDIFALGVDISCADIAASDAYTTASGTSMASGIVAGAAIQWINNYPTKTSAEIKDVILQEGHRKGMVRLAFDESLPFSSTDVYASIITTSLVGQVSISNLPSGRVLNVQLGQTITKDLELNLANATDLAVISFAPTPPWMTVDLATGILTVDTSSIDPSLVPGIYLFGIKGTVDGKVMVEEYSVGLYNTSVTELETATQYYYDDDTESYDEVVSYQVAPGFQYSSQKN
jgi:subtilisin family serine protease